jgi:hypothetical protein
MPRRAYELDPESLSIIIRSKDINDFDIASIACPGVSVVHPKRFAEGLSAKTF